MNVMVIRLVRCNPRAKRDIYYDMGRLPRWKKARNVFWAG